MHVWNTHQDIRRRIDRFSADDWNEFLAASVAEPSRMVEARLGLPDFANFAQHRIIWGFDTADHTMRIFSCRRPHDPPASGAAIDRRTHAYRRMISERYVNLGVLLFQLRESRPSVQQLRNLVNKQRRYTLGGKADLEAALQDSDQFVWLSVGKILLVGLFDVRALNELAPAKPQLPATGSKTPQSGDVSNGLTSTHERIGIYTLWRTYDYFLMQKEFWDAVPREYFKLTPENLPRLIRVFCDPLAFNPKTATQKTDFFLWPWQRCLEFDKRGGKAGRVKTAPIETTSVVLDLRSSTAALSLSIDPAEFSGLLERIVAKSKECFVLHGGYFDKETGDGVIGHFTTNEITSVDNSKTIEASSELERPVVRAVDAAIEIIRRVAAECRTFQPKLLHGLDGLAPAIGVHHAQGVWLSVGSQIRSIGGAVVGAARLCDAAQPAEILISNSTYEALGLLKHANKSRLFDRRAVEMKGMGHRTGAFAYGHYPIGPVIDS